MKKNSIIIGLAFSFFISHSPLFIYQLKIFMGVKI